MNSPFENLIDSATARAMAGNVSRTTFQRWVSLGRIPVPTTMPNKRLYWNREEFIAALNAMVARGAA
jgi:predicted site-specific integrase-resolvase